MKTLLDQALQVTEPTPARHNFFDFLGNCGRVTYRLVTSIGTIALVLSLSLFIFPATPAYAVDTVLTPREVVEYALTLEKLEADFYQRIATAFNTNLASAPDIAKQALNSYGQDEFQHVEDLSAVLPSLGGNPDAITITATPNYNAILGRDPFANLPDLLLALQNVEDTGVAAYKGQVQNLLADIKAGLPAAKTVLAAALAIHTVEARHAVGVRDLRRTLFNADIRPWVRKLDEVPFKKDKVVDPIPFASEAFDGFASRDEVLAIVGPILGLPKA